MEECMDFPNTFKEFIDEYSFKDREEIYTNGSELIQASRVMQGYEHFIAEHDKQIKNETIDNFVKIVNTHIRDEMVLGESVKWIIEDFAEQIKGEQNEIN